MEALNSLLILITISLLVLIFTHKLVRQSKSNRNLPPSPPSLPIIGHLYHLKRPLHRVLLALSRTYGPITFLRLGSRSVVIISSSSLAEECFTKNDIVLANRPKFIAGKHLGYNYSNVVNAPYGDHWRNLRRIGSTDVFSSRRLDNSIDVRRDEVRRLLQKLGRGSTGGFARVELKTAFTELTFNVMMRLMAGKRYYGDDVSDVEEATLFRDIIKEIVEISDASHPGDFLPILRWIDYEGYEKRILKLGEKTDRFLQGLVDEHRTKKAVSEQSEEKSMIDHLLTLQQSQPEYYTDEIIKGLVLAFLTAGTDTSSITMEWALASLVNHPHVLEKAKLEIDSQIGHRRLVDETDLSALPYLSNIILETLRLYPAVPLLLPHYSSQDCKMGGYDVPGDTMVMVNAWAIHRDPGLWLDPTSFKPERFEGKDGKANKLILSFGLGRRACPGATLAHKMVGLTLGSLIQCFEWKRLGEEEVDMEEGEGLTMPKAKPLEALCRARHVMGKLLSESPSTA